MESMEIVRAEYLKRKRRNSHYSMRAFAKALDIPSGRLSEILAKKRRITEKMGLHIADKLALSPVERQSFLKTICSEKASKKEKQQGHRDYQLPNFDNFYFTSDWYHYGILALLRTKNFKPCSRWIAQRLGISKLEIEEAMDRMVRLQVLEKTDEGWQRKIGTIKTTEDIPSAALKKAHMETLERAILSLDDVPVQERDLSSVTIACNPNRLAEAKDRIRKFRRELADFLESSEDKTEVYELSLQLVPLTRLV